MGVQKDPVVLNVPNHLVYEPHAYIRQNDFENAQAISTAKTLLPCGWANLAGTRGATKMELV